MDHDSYVLFIRWVGVTLLAVICYLWGFQRGYQNGREEQQ